MAQQIRAALEPMSQELATALAKELAALFGGNGLSQNQQIPLVAERLMPLLEARRLADERAASSAGEAQRNFAAAEAQRQRAEQAEERVRSMEGWAMQLVPSEAMLTYVNHRQYIEAYIAKLDRERAEFKTAADEAQLELHDLNAKCVDAKYDPAGDLRTALDVILGDARNYRDLVES